MNILTWIDALTQLPIRQEVRNADSDAPEAPVLLYSYSPDRATVESLPSDFFRPGAPGTVGYEQTSQRKAPGEPLGSITDLETGGPLEPLGLGTQLDTLLGTLKLSDRDVITERLGPLTSRNPDEPDLALADGPEDVITAPVTVVEIAYNLLSGVLPDAVPLSVISMAGNSTEARGWRETYRREAEGAQVVEPDQSFGGVRPFNTPIGEVIAYFLEVPDDRLSAFVDFGSTSVIIEGDFILSELGPIVSSLQPAQ